MFGWQECTYCWHKSPTVKGLLPAKGDHHDKLTACRHLCYQADCACQNYLHLAAFWSSATLGR